MTYSLFWVTNELPWLAEMLGIFRICLVLKSRRSIRAIRPPEPYNAKGIRYEGEYIQRKAGKSFVSSD